MQKSYTFWRATHPLVFISMHLIIGVILSKWLPDYSPNLAKTISIYVFLISLLLLLFISIGNKTGIIYSICISIIMITWGIGIHFASQSNTLFSIPYPSTIILKSRLWIIEKINRTVQKVDANGFALAILLGIKVNMEKDLMTAYTQLGIIHIVAISGMHLEILFANLKRMTSWLPRNKVFLIVELTILLLAVWIYTLMAFASPSIVRASVFFSIFTIGKFFGGNTFMLNTIAGGVLILLLFDIKGINGIGIQLSYAAVIGIHLFYKPFIKLIHINNPIVKFCWSNCCLSLAAQITTLPILAIHFHQIAGWVLVSNFIMVPLSNIILYALAILLLLPLKFDIALTWGQLTESYILFFNQTVRNWFMATKAGTVQISMGKSEICLYYIILLFVYLWLYFKRPGLILVVLGCICAYSLLKLFS